MFICIKQIPYHYPDLDENAFRDFCTLSGKLQFPVCTITRVARNAFSAFIILDIIDYLH